MEATEGELALAVEGNLLRRLPCQELDDDLIRHLQLAKRHKT